MILTYRKREILDHIVTDYIKDATPVASETISRNLSLDLSPATIRHEVAELEGEGYITRPYPSAGSVPLDKGYRMHVKKLFTTHGHGVPSKVRSAIRRRLEDVEKDIDEWTTVAAAMLAGLVGNMAIVTFPRAEDPRIRRVELVALQDLLVLVIVVFEEARLRRQLVRLETPIETSELQLLTNKVNDLVLGRTCKELESTEIPLSPLEHEVVSTTILVLREEHRARSSDHYIDGLWNLLGQPEFAENQRMRDVVEVVEDGSLAEAILDELPDARLVRVVIGQENRGDLLWPLGLVISQYGIPGQASGAVGAVGPIRMEYAKAIAGVEYMTHVMSEMVESVHS